MLVLFTDTDTDITPIEAAKYGYKLISMPYIIDGKERDTLQILDDYYNQGNDLKLFADQFLTFAMDIAKYVLFNSMDILKIPNNMEDKVKFCTNIEGANNYYTYLIDKLLDIKVLVRNDLNIKTTLEVMFLKLCRCK